MGGASVGDCEDDPVRAVKGVVISEEYPAEKESEEIDIVGFVVCRPLVPDVSSVAVAGLSPVVAASTPGVKAANMVPPTVDKVE